MTKILFIRPPRFRWPFHSENSSFWQPLGFASMAAVLRENIDDIDVRIIDCPILKKGWKQVPKILRREKPDIICIGEETVSSNEAVRLIGIARQELPHSTIICGGMYFSFMIKESLESLPIDYIIRGEGEMTLLELVRELKKKNPEPSKIKGLAFRKDRKVIDTGQSQPVADLDKLPFPAYDLLPMKLYGKGARSHPDFAAIEHSRGCTSNCNFCVLWKVMGKTNGSGKLTPCYRTKSVKRTIDEVTYLADKYKRKTFNWVDPTWNVDPKWNKKFAEEMIKTGLDVDHSTWMRADFVVRDEQKGIFPKLVKAGMKQVMIGLERTSSHDLRYLDKQGYTYSTTRKAFEVLRKYPEVLSIATYIYGIPTETRKSMRQFYDSLEEIPFDMGIPLPLTPNPGTKFFDDLDKRKLIDIKDFSYYNFVNPIIRSEKLSRNMIWLLMIYHELRVRTGKEQFASSGISAGRRSGAVRNLAKVKARMTVRFMGSMLSDAVLKRPINLNTKPEWYDG
ncbi:MAG: radical SAM protein [Candidatus Woesearchaeota archaeon]